MALTGFGQDVRYGVRQMMRAPGFAVTAILTLALGIGANTAIFTVFNQVLLRMLPVEKPQELVQVSAVGSDRGSLMVYGGDAKMYFSYPMYRDLRAQNTVFSGLIADVERGAGVVWKNQSALSNVEMVSGNYFQVLGVPSEVGRTLVDADDQVKNGAPVVVVSDAYWRTTLDGEASVVGQTLLINGHPFQIIGVAARGFSSAISGYKPDLFVPITMETQVTPGSDDLDKRRSRWLTLVGRLKPGVSAATAEASLTVLWKQLRAGELAQMSNVSDRFKERFVEKSNIVLVDDSKGFSPLRDSLKTPLLILMGMVVLLAAMTCMNLTSLLLVRGASRGKEFAVRYALGAARGRVLRQMMVEGVLLGVAGGLLGLALAPAAAAFLVRRVTDSTGEAAFSTSPDGWVLAFNLVLSLGISVLFSMAPAWHLLRPDLTDALRQQAGGTFGGAQRLRTAAVGMQIGLSVLLLSGAGLFTRTLEHLKGQEMGLATDHLVEFSMDPTMAGYPNADVVAVHKRVQAALAGLPGVKAVAATNDPVLAGNEWVSNVMVEGHVLQPEEDSTVEAPVTMPGLFRALQIPMLAGRDFTEGDVAASGKVAIVNRKFAVKYFGSAEKALGHYLVKGGTMDKLDTQIVGVVEDFKQRGVRDELIPSLFTPNTQNDANMSTNGMEFYVRTTQSPEAAENMVRQAVQGIDPKLVVDGLQTMEEQIDANVSNERMMALLAACFALIALLTTAVGLYGVLAYATAQRTREIGIRMALGAQRWSVVRMVLGDMGKVAGVGIVVALPVSVALARTMKSQMFEVSAFDPVTMVGCVLVTYLMVLVAAAIPARRAASINPTVALRTE